MQPMAAGCIGDLRSLQCEVDVVVQPGAQNAAVGRVIELRPELVLSAPGIAQGGVVAEIVVQVFTLHAPLRRNHVFQARAHRPTHLGRGIVDDVTGWAKRLQMPVNTLRGRLENGWPFEIAVNTPTETNKRKIGNQLRRMLARIEGIAA